MSDRIKIIFGGASFGSRGHTFSDEDKKAILDILEKYGVKDLDTAALYVCSPSLPH